MPDTPPPGPAAPNTSRVEPPGTCPPQLAAALHTADAPPDHVAVAGAATVASRPVASV